MELFNTACNAATVNAALRAYLRWRATHRDAVQRLLAVIASPAHWTLASQPRALKLTLVFFRQEAEELSELLGDFELFYQG